MPQKPAKFGIKFWMLGDTYNVLGAFPQVGKEDRALTGIGKFVTWSLLEPYRNAGLNVTCDNFFYMFVSCQKLAKKYISVNHHRISKRNSEGNLI